MVLLLSYVIHAKLEGLLLVFSTCLLLWDNGGKLFNSRSFPLLPLCLRPCQCLYIPGFGGLLMLGFVVSPSLSFKPIWSPISTLLHVLSILHPRAWWLLVLVSVYQLLCLWNQSAEALLAPEVPKWVSFQTLGRFFHCQTELSLPASLVF